MTSAGSGSSAVSASASLVNLAPATTYHYRLVAASADGTATGPDQTFTTDPDVAPSVLTGAADGLTRTAAALHGTVTPNGQATTWRIEYGTTTTYGTSTPEAPAGNGFADVAVAAPLGDVLAPGTTYHYRVVATNATGTTKGADQAFSTGVRVLADAATGAASAISEFGARIAGSVNPNASASAVWFEYGTDTTYAGRIDAAASLTGASAQAVSAVLTGLAPATTYHYRVAARNAVGTSYGPDQVLTTAVATAASTTTAPASQVGVGAATLNGYVATGSYATSVAFEWGLDTTYGQSTAASSLPAASGGQATAVAIAGLQPRTTYHYRLVATNALGAVRGADQTLTTQPLPPPGLGAVQAGAASVSGATLSGSAVPNGLATQAHFEWGTTTAYGSRGADVALGAGTDPQSLTLSLSSLSPATTYHYRLVAANETGTTYGADMTFTTLNPAPVTATAAASAVGPTQATLSANVNPNGIAATLRFEYGPTTAYGASTAAVSAGSGSAARALTTAVGGLAAHTTYHYRAVATNATGTTYGDDQTVTTAWFAVPSVGTDAETGTTYSSTTVHGHVDPNGAPTTYRFEYGPTTAYGAATTERQAGAALVSGPVSADLSGLAAGTAYHVRLVATNETGTSYGDDRVVSTPAWLAPTAATGATLQLAGTSVTLVGRVNANDAATTSWFEYGATAAYGAATAPAQASGRVQVQVTAAVASLSPGTTYHYRLVARSAGGTTAGADATFTTPAAPVADQAAPTVKIGAPTCPASIRGKACTSYLQTTAAWKTLKGTVSDASGIDSVEVSLWRKGADGKCYAYSGDGFKALRCDKAAAVWVDAVVSGSSWKLALRSLPAGAYTLRVRASDTAGNDVTAFRAGQNQLSLKLSPP